MFFATPQTGISAGGANDFQITWTVDPEKSKRARAVARKMRGKKAGGGRSAYILFSMERREALLKKNPNLKFGEVGKALGAEWAKMSDSQKKKYTDMADEGKKSAAKAAKKASKTEKKTSSKSKSSTKTKAAAKGKSAGKKPVAKPKAKAKDTKSKGKKK